MEQVKTLEKTIDADMIFIRLAYGLIKDAYSFGLIGKIKNYFSPFPPFKEYCEKIYYEDLARQERTETIKDVLYWNLFR